MAKFNFEDSMKNLETIVKKLESGDTTLDESIKDFEEGAALYKQCKKYLNSVEKKVQILTDSLEENNIEE